MAVASPGTVRIPFDWDEAKRMELLHKNRLQGRRLAFHILIFPILLFCHGEAKDLAVDLDTSEVPGLASWGLEGKQLMEEWYPRIANLLSSPADPPAHPTVQLKLKKADKGVGATSGTRITIASSWIEKRPDDFGLLIHELTHVIQMYPRKEPEWVTEGIADYIRWAIYEGKSQHEFPAPDDAKGYLRGYQPTAGFFLWLETHRAPGIVRRLNTAMKRATYSAEIFQTHAGDDLDSLWADYLAFRKG